MMSPTESSLVMLWQRPKVQDVRTSNKQISPIIITFYLGLVFLVFGLYWLSSFLHDVLVFSSSVHSEQ